MSAIAPRSQRGRKKKGCEMTRSPFQKVVAGKGGRHGRRHSAWWRRDADLPRPWPGMADVVNLGSNRFGMIFCPAAAATGATAAVADAWRTRFGRERRSRDLTPGILVELRFRASMPPSARRSLRCRKPPPAGAARR